MSEKNKINRRFESERAVLCLALVHPPYCLLYGVRTCSEVMPWTKKVPCGTTFLPWQNCTYAARNCVGVCVVCTYKRGLQRRHVPLKRTQWKSVLRSDVNIDMYEFHLPKTGSSPGRSTSLTSISLVTSSITSLPLLPGVAICPANQANSWSFEELLASVKQQVHKVCSGT